MPELPEVETIVGGLRDDIIGKSISSVRFLRKSIWRTKAPLPEKLIGSTIKSLERKGKNILTFLSNGQVLIIHLKMTGRLTFEKSDNPVKKHTHFIAELNSGQLRFNDIRRFGYLDLIAADKLETLDYLSALGPDALEISKADFAKLIKSKKRNIKSLLLDQTMIAGMGNIYTDEALFAAGIHPKRTGASLNSNRTGRLYDAMITILNKAIIAHGSSVDNYVDARGARGSFQEQHNVYGREDEPCKKCGRPIKRIVIGSRSTHFCLHCQK